MTVSQEIFKLAGSHGRGLVREMGLSGKPSETWLSDLHKKNHPVYPYLMVISMCVTTSGDLIRLLQSAWSAYRLEDPAAASERYCFKSLEDYDRAFTEFTEEELSEMGEIFLKDRYYPSVSEILAMTDFRQEHGYIAPELFLPLMLEDSSVMPSISQ